MPKFAGAVERDINEKVGERPSVLDWIPSNHHQSIFAGTCTTDLTAYIQNAIDSGVSIFVPPGVYFSSLLTISTAGQSIYGSGRGKTIFCKYSDSPLFKLNASFSGISGVSLYGAYDAFGDGSLVRPAGSVSITDTTDGIVIGDAGTGQPFQWVLDDVLVYCCGRDGIHWLDGPSPIIDGIFTSYHARWGMWVNQIAYMAGPGSDIDGVAAVDTSHAHIGRFESIRCGRGSYTVGGGMMLQGNSHTIANIKVFGQWGDGLVMSSHSSRARVFCELVGRGNTDIPAWTNGHAYTAGAMVRNNKTVYLATTSGTSGGSAPTHTSGTASDGGVTWQYRRGIGAVVTSEFYQCNKLDLLFANTDDGYSASGENEISGFSSSADPGVLGQNLAAVKTLRISRTIDFANVAGGGSYEAVMLRPKPSGSTARDFELSGQGSTNPFDLWAGDSGQGLLRLRGANGYIADIAVGCLSKSVSGNYSLYSQSVAEADTYLIDASGGACSFNLWKGGIGAVSNGRVVRLVKVDSSSNVVTVYVPDSPGHIRSTTTQVTGSTDFVEMLAQWESRTFLLTDATNGVWIEVDRENGIDSAGYCQDTRRENVTFPANGNPVKRFRDTAYDPGAWTNYFGASSHATAGLALEMEFAKTSSRKAQFGFHLPSGTPTAFMNAAALEFRVANALAARIGAVLTASRPVKTDSNLSLVSASINLTSSNDVSMSGSNGDLATVQSGALTNTSFSSLESSLRSALLADTAFIDGIKAALDSYYEKQSDLSYDVGVIISGFSFASGSHTHTTDSHTHGGVTAGTDSSGSGGGGSTSGPL